MTNQTKVERGIYRLEDGRYRVHTTATDPYTGRIRHKKQTLRHGATLEDARKTRDQLKAEIVTANRPRGPAATTVGDYAVFWAEQKVPKLKPSTRRGYIRSMIVVCDYLGELPIRDMVRADVANLVRHLETLRKPDGSSYSTHTVRGWYRIVKIMLADAVADGLLDTDPSSRVEPPTTGVRAVQERDTLSADDLGALVEAARVHTPDRYAEIVTLTYTGMRSGELYGLQWDAVDFEAGRITIRRAVSNRVLVPSTKTGAPRETVAPAVVLEALRAHQTKTGATSGLVFPASNGKPRGGDTLRRPLELAAKAAGLDQRVTPQVLRRTFNTLLVAAGVDRIVQRSMLGHTSEQMTERYSGVRLEDKHAAALRIIQGGKS